MYLCTNCTTTQCFKSPIFVNKFISIFWYFYASKYVIFSQDENTQTTFFGCVEFFKYQKLKKNWDKNRPLKIVCTSSCYIIAIEVAFARMLSCINVRHLKIKKVKIRIRHDQKIRSNNLMLVHFWYTTRWSHFSIPSFHVNSRWNDAIIYLFTLWHCFNGCLQRLRLVFETSWASIVFGKVALQREIFHSNFHDANLKWLQFIHSRRFENIFHDW